MVRGVEWGAWQGLARLGREGQQCLAWLGREGQQWLAGLEIWEWDVMYVYVSVVFAWHLA